MSKTVEHISVNNLVVSASPHIRGPESISTIMWTVNLTLLPLTIHAIFNFGIAALITLATSILGAMLTEALIQLWQKKTITIYDGSAFLTGLLLALCLPPNLPWGMTLFGAVTSIGIAKHMFGGLGNNVFNPALIGRAIIMASFPAAMTTWGISILSAGHPITSTFMHIDAITSATPLEILKHQGYDHLVNVFGGNIELYKTMLFGNKTACGLGETSAFLTILGGLFLIWKGYIKWQVPLVMVGTVGLLTWIFSGSHGLFTGDPIFHMMAGGLLLGAFFMATDMVTTPISIPGKIIFAFGCGSITTLIRLVGGYPEGVCYSILLMNTLTPLIDRLFVPKKFGTIKDPRRGVKNVADK